MTVTPTQAAIIAKAQADGKTRQQAAELAGVSLSTVARHWKPTGAGRREGFRPRSKRTAIEALLNAGDSVEQIAKALNVSASLVRRYRRELAKAGA